MNLTVKERELLSDLRTQEKLCVEKYGKYEEQACDPALRALFSSVKSAEEGHLTTVERVLAGEDVTAKPAPSAESQKLTVAQSTCTEAEKHADAYLCQDAITMEKHVSALYDTTVFESVQPALRDVLGAIQKEEQNHGQQFYEYLSINNLTGIM